MTDTERALQLAIDRDPTDWLARGALADYLEEIGDERAQGWRALNAKGRVPWYWAGPRGYGWWNPLGAWDTIMDDIHLAVLPPVWFEQLDLGGITIQTVRPFELIVWKPKFGACHSLNEAALAFTKLHPDRQAELLTAPASGG